MQQDRAPDPLELEVKVLPLLEIKNEERGEIEAVIVTLDVVDLDHDIIRPGAIPDGSKVKLSDYGHSVAFGAPPVGKGVLRTKGNKVIFEGNYFMTTSKGQEAFKTVKELGPDDQEWSFGFSVNGAEMPEDDDRKKGAYRILTKLDSFEVSPVIRGAGIGTRTVSVKAAGANPPPEPPTAEDEALKAEEEAETAKQAEAERLKSEQKAAEEAEAQQKATEAAEAQRQLQAEIDSEVERFQRTQRLFNL